MSGPWMKGGDWRAAIERQETARNPAALRNMSCPPRTPVKMVGENAVGSMIRLWTPRSVDSADPLDAWRTAFSLSADSSTADVLACAHCSAVVLPPVAPIRMNPGGARTQHPAGKPRKERPTPRAPVPPEAKAWSLWVRLRSSRTVFIAAMHPIVRPDVLTARLAIIVPPQWEVSP